MNLFIFLLGCALIAYAGIVEECAIQHGDDVPTRAHIAGGVGMALALAALIFWGMK